MRETDLRTFQKLSRVSLWKLQAQDLIRATAKSIFGIPAMIVCLRSARPKSVTLTRFLLHIQSVPEVLCTSVPHKELPPVICLFRTVHIDCTGLEPLGPSFPIRGTVHGFRSRTPHLVNASRFKIGKWLKIASGLFYSQLTQLLPLLWPSGSECHLSAAAQQ